MSYPFFQVNDREALFYMQENTELFYLHIGKNIQSVYQST